MSLKLHVQKLEFSDSRNLIVKKVKNGRFYSLKLKGFFDTSF
jgi:hypothetical protein